MIKLRHWLSITLLVTLLFPLSAPGQSTLTLIRDTVYQPNGTPFQGTVVITWISPSTPTGSNPTPNSTSVKIYNGALSVLLVPSTTATPSAYYQAIYNSSDGLVSWTEAWQVPASVVPLSLSSVRTTASGSSSGTSNGTVSISQVTGLNSYLNSLNGALTSLTAAENTLNSTVGTLGNTVSGLTTTTTNLSTDVSTLKTNFSTLSGTVSGYGTSISSITTDVAGLKPNVDNLKATVSSLGTSLGSVSSDVSNLKSSTAVMNSTLTSLSSTISGIGTDESALRTTVTNLNSSFSTMSAKVDTLVGAANLVFVDAEVPGGTIDGTNAVFSLAKTPSTAINLALYRNGIILSNGKDYTLSGTNITFLGGAIPQAGDSLQAFYRTAGTGQIPSFVDSEVPVGSINGSNRVFTIATAPNPVSSLKLYRNGVLLKQNSDYTLNGTSITFVTAATPQSGDSLVVFYRTL
jgi:prefoldin subunit 5